MTLIIEHSRITDSTELWGALDAVSEALGNTLGVASHWLGAEFLGNDTYNTMTLPKGSTETVSTLAPPLSVGWVLSGTICFQTALTAQ